MQLSLTASMTLWGKLLKLVGTHMIGNKTPRQDLLDMLTMLHETNEETMVSPRASAIAGRHLMWVHHTLGDA